MDMTDIIKRYQGDFKLKYAKRITQQQLRAMQAVLDCRSDRYGSMALDCTECDFHTLNHHACGNRACHRCQNHDTTQWLERQSQKLLPVEYFMVTFTLPRELRSLAWHHQKAIYADLLQCARSTLSTFALNDKNLGADIGMTMVLHTHSRQLDYHPHVHVIVPGVCVNRQRKQCTKVRSKYLFNEFALAAVFRARFLEAIHDDGFEVPEDMPKKWVADCRHVGKGLPALQYLSRYLYRGVISEKNILSDDGEKVTFAYTDSQTGRYKTRTVKGAVFLWLVYQHVLPKGFRRVRDYGYLHGNAKLTLKSIQIALRVLIEKIPPKPRPAYLCKVCGAPLTIKGFIRPLWHSG
jgi:hypothetical protein